MVWRREMCLEEISSFLLLLTPFCYFHLVLYHQASFLPQPGPTGVSPCCSHPHNFTCYMHLHITSHPTHNLASYTHPRYSYPHKPQDSKLRTDDLEYLIPTDEKVIFMNHHSKLAMLDEVTPPPPYKPHQSINA